MKEVSEELSVSKRFEMKLRSALDCFELLADFVNEGSIIAFRDVSGRLAEDEFSGMKCVSSLAHKFIFEVIRLRRVIEHGHADLQLEPEFRRHFLRELKVVLHVRNVNEHGYDIRGNENSQPSMHPHEHDGLNLALDETSIIVLSPQKILIGPINIYDVNILLNQLANATHGFVRARLSETRKSFSQF
ncbi:hypothetical protein [Pararhodobacter sp.]|uniref:hypothetical protein n=1 Tax=Pararhodobacter sp. TaxID=2127056 RepID=UPI002FDE8E94